MGFLEYVNSIDIREYWKAIGYEPSALEAAWLVWQGKNQTLQKKHDSWLNIVSESKDFAVPDGDFNLPQPSLHKFLERYMFLENELIAAFYRNENNAVYTYRMYFDDDGDREWYNEPAIFDNFDEAYDHAKDGNEPPHPNFVEFVKSYIGKDGKKIFVRFNLEKEIVRVDESNYFADEKDYEIFQEVFRNMRFKFPTPFKKGDIVKTVRGLYTRPSYCGGTFVLTSIEKVVHGFSFDATGAAFHGCIQNYLDLEYDARLLVNEERALATISKYLKGEVDLATLLNEYHYVLSINAANRIRLLTNRTKY